jgi:hypothetical protein
MFGPIHRGAAGLLLAALLAVPGCERRSPEGETARPASPEIVAGVYTSTTFIEPGQNDAGVDVHAAGGFSNLTLTTNFGVEGKLVIPPGTGSNYDGTNLSFLGTWRTSGSGIVIEGTRTLLDGHEWICGTGTLETSTTGRGPLQIKFQKMHDLR